MSLLKVEGRHNERVLEVEEVMFQQEGQREYYHVWFWDISYVYDSEDGGVLVTTCKYKGKNIMDLICYLYLGV